MPHPPVAPESLEVLALIPARGGSKGIPRKNLAPLGGKPLIVWTIEAARAAELVSRVAVSTDDDEIAQVARGAGAEVISRPAELSGDAAQTEPALEHAVAYLREREGYRPDLLVMLQCTSPLRGAETIERGIRLLAETGCDCVLSVSPIQNPHVTGTLGPAGLWQPRYRYDQRALSQQVEPLYAENGALYVLRREVLETYHNRLGGEVHALVMDPLRSVDIDRPEDLRLAEALMQVLGPPR